MPVSGFDEAYVFFADLDHLKEINDKYGHGEGDFAIENIANILKNSLPKDAIISRMGGDEFVAMILKEDGIDDNEIIRNIKDMMHKYNAILAKTYYIECSVGSTLFTCSKYVSLEDVMNSADEALYEAKKLRRATVVKGINIW